MISLLLMCVHHWMTQDAGDRDMARRRRDKELRYASRGAATDGSQGWSAAEPLEYKHLK